MENYLKEINAVLGVVGSFICLPDGRIAAQALPETFDAASAETAARVLSQTFNALETSGQRVVETDLVYGQGRLLLKNLRGGILTIVCARNINVPLLNLTANGIAKKIASELKPTKPVSTAAMPSTAEYKSPSLDVLAEGPRAAPAEKTMGPDGTGEEVEPAPANPTVDMSSAEVIPLAPAEAPAGSIPAQAELADDKFFAELTRELTRVMGPVSGIIVEDEIETLNEKREAFPKSREAELVARVSLAIHDEAKRGKFLQVMSTLVQKQ